MDPCAFARPPPAPPSFILRATTTLAPNIPSPPPPVNYHHHHPAMPPPCLPHQLQQQHQPMPMYMYTGGNFLDYLLSDFPTTNLPTYDTSSSSDESTTEANVPLVDQFTTASELIDDFITRYCINGGGDEDEVQRCLALVVAEKWMDESYQSWVYPQYVVAACAIFLARLVLPGLRPWTPELEKVTGLTSNDMDECLYAMNEFCDPRSLLQAM